MKKKRIGDLFESRKGRMDYLLGKTEADNSHHRKVFWLFADAPVRYLFIEFGDYKNDKIRSGRIASMKVEFVET